MAPELTIEVTDLLDQHRKDSKKLWETWRQNNSDQKFMRPFAAEGTAELTIDTYQKAVRLLAPAQKKRFRQLELQQLGWDVVHRQEVQEALSLSTKQIVQFKDSQLQLTLLNSQLRRAIRSNSTTEIEETQIEIQTLKSQFKTILTTPQSNRLEKMVGKRLSPQNAGSSKTKQ